MKTNYGIVFVVAALMGALALSGCHSIGPHTVTTDRFDYTAAISDSWKQQILLNIVKIRYLDLPVFVDVASIVAGYSLQTGVSAGGTLSSESGTQGNFLMAGAQAVYTDRPTITYQPMTGQKFLRGLLTPIDPKNIFFMLQSGYAADFVLGLSVQSINGVRNRSVAAGVGREADPEFLHVLQLLREVQAAGAVGMRVEVGKNKDENAVVFFRRENLPPEIMEKTVEIRRLLKMPEDLQKFSLVYSPMPGATNELTVGSRSMFQIMSAFASCTDVPESDLKEQRALPTFSSTNNTAVGEQVRIKCSPEKPANAFAAVHYRNKWFWVDDRDWRTKRALSAIIFMFTMADTGGNEQLPLITIPAQ